MLCLTKTENDEKEEAITLEFCDGCKNNSIQTRGKVKRLHRKRKIIKNTMKWT